MGLFAVDGDLQRIQSRHRWAHRHGHRAGLTRGDVLSQDYLRLRNTVPEPVIDHRLSTLPGLLAGLKDQHQRSAPAASAAQQHPQGT